MEARFILTGIAMILSIASLSLFTTHTHAQQQRDIAFRNVDVFDGYRMIRQTTVLVRNSMVRAIGTDLLIPSSTQIIDGKGKTLLPGLFDAHTHLGEPPSQQFLEDALDFGVTTEIEMFGGYGSLALKKRMSTDSQVGVADFRTTGIGVTVPRGHATQFGISFPTLSPSDDVQAFIDARITEGADYIKVIYEHLLPTLTRQQLEDVVAAAHRRNKLVVAHIRTQSEAREAIAAGVDGLVHISSNSLPEPSFAEFAAQHNIFVIPTLSVIESTTAGSAKSWWQDLPNLARYITPSMRRTLEIKIPAGFAADQKLSYAQATVRQLPVT
ncbi:MAG: amidohydrolase family protein [Acidobacteriota bacterium]